jgi:hypothetical protein
MPGAKHFSVPTSRMKSFSPVLSALPATLYYLGLHCLRLWWLRRDTRLESLLVWPLFAAL